MILNSYWTGYRCSRTRTNELYPWSIRVRSASYERGQCVSQSDKHHGAWHTVSTCRSQR